jgi:hypothetical protein
MMLGGAVGAGWVYQQVFEESFGAWPLILLVSLVSGFLFGTALRSPPVSDTTPKARPGTEREST